MNFWYCLAQPFFVNIFLYWNFYIHIQNSTGIDAYSKHITTSLPPLLQVVAPGCWIVIFHFILHFTCYSLYIWIAWLFFFLLFHIVQKTKISAFLSVCQRTAGQIDKVSVTDNMSVSFIFFTLQNDNFCCYCWEFYLV